MPDVDVDVVLDLDMDMDMEAARACDDACAPRVAGASPEARRSQARTTASAAPGAGAAGATGAACAASVNVNALASTNGQHHHNPHLHLHRHEHQRDSLRHGHQSQRALHLPSSQAPSSQALSSAPSAPSSFYPSSPSRQRGPFSRPRPASPSATPDFSCHQPSAAAFASATTTALAAATATATSSATATATATSSASASASAASASASAAASAACSSASASSRRRRHLTANDFFLGKPPASLDANMAERETASTPQRDSHEISLSSRDVTRDSLVVNMLLSLDQFSFSQPPTPSSFGSRGPGAPTASIAGYDDQDGDRGDYDQEDDDDDDDDGDDDDDLSNNQHSRPYNNDSTANSRVRYDSGRHHPRHQPSYNSDSDVGIVQHSGKQSAALPPSRGRRSNSGSSHLQTSSFPQPNNKREIAHRSQVDNNNSSNNVHQTPPRSSHTRGGMHSNKSSSSASIDMGCSKTSVKSQRSGARPARSASFDHGPPPSRIPQLPVSSSCHVDFPQASVDDYYAAAPTPNVPGGPRREAFGLHTATHPPPPPSLQSADSRRPASRSTKSSAGKSKKAAAAPSTRAMPAEELDSAPAPSVGYGKSKGSDAAASASSQAKERPGFFRRVFGSSSKTSVSINSSNCPSSQTNTSQVPSAANPTTHAEHQQSASSSREPASNSLRDASSSHSSHHPPLQKKSSSFFRRRKKSIVDVVSPVSVADPVPPLPSLHYSTVHGHQGKDDMFAPPQNPASPTSSLRQVMSQFLREGSAGPGLGLASMALSMPASDIGNTPRAKSESRGEAGNEEYKRDFSPDYDPSPNARIRRVKPEADAQQPESTPSRPPKQTQKMLRHSNSFLNLDPGSDNDDAGGGSRKWSSKRRGLPSSSTSVSAPASTSASADRSRGDDEDREATVRGKANPLKELVEANQANAQSTLEPRVDGGRSTSFASASTETGYQTAPSAAPSVVLEGSGEPSPQGSSPLDMLASSKPLDEPDFVIGEPTEDDRQKAQRIYDGGEEFIQKDKAAAWMGEQGPIRQRTLQAYMELYSFTDQSILDSLRRVCQRLVLKAETQQVDRILVAFSKRWCDCNPQHGFKATDVIHTICYSIMLLNTDLHVADIEQKMTRSQFVKNTMTTIKHAMAESTAPAAFVRPSILPEKNPNLLSVDTTSHHATESSGRSYLSAYRPSSRPDTNSSDRDDCGPLVKASFHGSVKAWEEQVETVLKSIYASIREERLPLFGAESERSLNLGPSQSSLVVLGGLRRTPSVLSKAPSDTQLSSRGRVADNASRTSASRWTSKSRSRPGWGRTGLSSSRTSFDDGHSMWSPAMTSATWSKHSLGRTQGSMSQDSFASSMPRGDYQQSIGFANALSQAIIRDEDANGQETAPSVLSADMSSTQFLEDESLELAGPPWMKEGMVMHKHHLDGCGKRAKDRNWTEVFAVVQKGQISLFSFNASKSTRQKSRSRTAGRPMGPVGGGNWQDNAVSLGTFNLRLTLASALPSPGYSRSRPHVWALSLPTGAVHLFQVGTTEIIREFVNTANYWSARLSSHPLVGGISNIEYGWSESIVNNALVSAINESTTSLASGALSRNARPESSAAHVRKPSTASGSFRGTSLDHVSSAFTHNSGRGKLPGDRIHIAEWTPPTQSMRPSNATETEQLSILIAYVKSIETELQDHNRLRSPMLLAFTPRGQNAGKAMGNWERRSAYLLREIVKFRTYVDCLQQAEARKQEIYAERDLAAQKGVSGGDVEMSDEEDADETLRP
ncbi:hypothetical protein E4U55_003148 [Claviceps digitariae]|nr:hypothetical protein E4U55_003148 [Claviceps digitariae]